MISPGQAVAVDPDQRAAGGLGDEVVAQGGFAGIPPAGFHALGAGQQLQRAAIEQRALLALVQGLGLGQQPQRLAGQGVGLVRLAAGITGAGQHMCRISRLPAGGALGPVVGDGAQAQHVFTAEAGLQALDQTGQTFALAGLADEQFTVGGAAGLRGVAVQAQLQRRGGQRQPA